MISVMKNFLKEHMSPLKNLRSVLSNIFGYLLLLTIFFILIESAFFILCNESYLHVITFVADRIHLPLSIIPSLLFFVFAQLLLHVGFCLLISLIAAAGIIAWNIAPSKQLLFSVYVWLAGVITILVANSYYFPHSHFSQLIFLPHDVLGIVLSVIGCGWLIVSGLTLISFAGRSLSPRAVILRMLLARDPASLIKTVAFSLSKNLRSLMLGILVIFSLLGLAWWQLKNKPTSYASAATISQPNIILVGVDSLRPTALDFFGGDVSAPFINQFLTKATVFNEAVTPLARTYPSWVGILTGQYPLQTGVRTNLVGAAKIALTQTLPALLREKGYETWYATDETRFSNIDKTFGFDEIITPPVGLRDFLLGTFNDFPLSNLIVNTRLGKWFFPYSYANRPAYVTYDPNSFLHLVQPAILQNHPKPVFLAVHFCLPHHPYIYARMRENMTGQERYLQSIVRADQQLRDFFKLLQQGGLLKHAVVVLLSDHGEALELPGDRITEREAYVPQHHTAPVYYPSSADKLAMNQSVGHGTDVMGLPQYHSLLAFKLYGLGKQHNGIIPGVVSLLDIKPTVLSLSQALSCRGRHCEERFMRRGNPELTCRDRHCEERFMRRGNPELNSNEATQPSNIMEPGVFTSISLLPQILGASSIPPTRPIFLESDYSPDALRSVYPETRKLLLEGADLFQINPTTMRVSVKEQMVDMIIKSKQYAVIYGHWMLASYPQANHSRVPVFIDLKTGVWTTDLTSSFAQTSPVKTMQLALQNFYGKELL